MKHSAKIHEGLSISHPNELYIDGKWVAPHSKETLTVISPSDETVAGVVATADATDMDAAVAAARRAFDTGPWPTMTPKERAVVLRRLAALLRARGAEFATCWALQTGVPISMGSFAFQDAGRLYDYYADLIEKQPQATVSLRDNGQYAVVVNEAVGVVAAVAPWNHPFHTLSLKVAPALAMGCCVVAKPAPESPLDVFILAECADAAGLPPGVLNIAPAGRDASDYLVRHAGVDKVSFTGSTVTGRHIASICGGRMARSSMELGGKSAAIVLDDVPIEDVVKTLVPGGGYHMAGQGCAYLTRILVSRHRRDALAEAYAAELQKLRVGHALDPQTQMGPLAMERQYEKVKGFIAKGLEQGARIVTGGKRPGHLEKGGYFLEPTLFVDVTNEMAIAQEEIFGPVWSMIAFDTEEDAIRIANDSVYGLNGAVYTNDVDKAYAIGRRVRAGNFAHNGLEHDSKFPFGGFRQSGTGREGGPWALELYTEVKTVYLRDKPSTVV